MILVPSAKCRSYEAQLRERMCRGFETMYVKFKVLQLLFVMGCGQFWLMLETTWKIFILKSWLEELLRLNFKEINQKYFSHFPKILELILFV